LNGLGGVDNSPILALVNKSNGLISNGTQARHKRTIALKTFPLRLYE
jgi:hypothetical protein